MEAWLGCCDPSIEFHSSFADIDAPVRGHGGLRKWRKDLEDAWGEDIQIEPEAYFDLGEQSLSFYVLHGRGRHSGADVAMPIAQVSSWRDGLMVYFKSHQNRENALHDLGISEDTLVPIDP